MIDRRLFLLSTAGLVGAPDAWLAGSGSPPPAEPVPAAGPPPPPLDLTASFDAWRVGFIDRAVAKGLPREEVTLAVAGLTLDPRVTNADGKQPELSRSMGDYLAGTVSAARISQGQAQLAQGASWMQPIAEKTGVPAEILVSVWGMESNFGKIQGDYDVIRSLATLAAEGRRRDFAEAQLMAALKIVFSGEARRDQLKGSWAGAMGQTQFTPEDYLAWAVDADGDGKRDIWGSSQDAIGSAGQFLARKAAWRRGEGWAREVVLPAQGFDYGLAEGERHPYAWWTDQGVQPADDQTWSASDAAEAAGLILPAGWSGPAFLILPNHMAIRAYNNATTYALAVGLLADRIAGRAPLVRAWPAETPIGRDDRIAAQAALVRLGFDPGTPDGVMGLRTRAAAREWQRSRGLPADGYLTYGLIQALKLQAGLSPAPTL